MTATLAAGQEPAPPIKCGAIIVGVDDTPGGLAALRYAVEIARATGAPLVAVRVWALGLPRHGGLRRPGTGRGRVVLAFRAEEPRAAAARLARRAFRAAVGGIPGDLDVTIETPEGSPGPVLTQLALARGGVLVVGRTHGHLAKRALHGSVSAYCARHLPGQVTVVSQPVTVASQPAR